MNQQGNINDIISRQDPDKQQFIEEILNLANMVNNPALSSPENILILFNKTYEELFFIKYELTIQTIDPLDLFINFKTISTFIHINNI